MDFYRKVTHKQYSNGKPMANMSIYNKQAREQKLAKEAEAKAALESQMVEMKKAKRASAQVGANKILVEGLKNRVIREVNEYVPLMIMNEFFSRVVLTALPHDEDFIEEHSAAIEAANKVFLYRIGGYKTLKERAKITNSSVLKSLCSVVKENSDSIIKDKVDQIRNASSEDEIIDVLNSGIDGDTAANITDDLDSMDPDRISELVQNKVVDVVKDEKARQEEDQAFRTELKNKAEGEMDEAEDAANNPPENASTEASEDDDADMEDEENCKGKKKGKCKDKDSEDDEECDKKKCKDKDYDEDDDENDDDDSDDDDMKDEENDDEEKEESTKENATLAKYLVDPTVLHENTFFYSLVQSVYKNMIGVAPAKSAYVSRNRKVACESALNFEDFEKYVKDYGENFKHVDDLIISDREPIASTESAMNEIDSEMVLAEALVQYTILETAMTLQLIDPSASEVHMVTTYNLNR